MAAAKKATARKSTAKKATAKKSTAKKSTAKKATAKKSTAKKATKKSATKKSTARRTSAASSGGNVVVASKVKEAIRNQDVRMSSEFVDALNQQVNELISRAAGRAKGNGRTTVRPGDL